jgi:hypothetical protein
MTPEICIGRFGKTEEVILSEMAEAGGKEKYLRVLIVRASDQMKVSDLFGAWATISLLDSLTSEPSMPSTKL